MDSISIQFSTYELHVILRALAVANGNERVIDDATAIDWIAQRLRVSIEQNRPVADTDQIFDRFCDQIPD